MRILIALLAALVAIAHSASPAFAQDAAPLGTLTFEAFYDTPLTLRLTLINRCKSSERIDIFLEGLPFIDTVPRFDIVHPGVPKEVIATGRTPKLPSFTLG